MFVYVNVRIYAELYQYAMWRSKFMKLSKRITALLSAAFLVMTVLPGAAYAAEKPRSDSDGMNMFDRSDFIEKGTAGAYR